jgi:hypothetical protein
MLQGRRDLALVLQSLKLTLELVAFDDEGVSLPQKCIPLAQGNIPLPETTRPPNALSRCLRYASRSVNAAAKAASTFSRPLEEHGPAPLNEFVAALSYMRGQTVRKHRRATVDAGDLSAPP